MADAITLEIVTPDGVKLKEEVSELTAPGADGEFGVLPSHRPMLAALETGMVGYIQGGKRTVVAVGAGFFEVQSDHAVVLTDRFITKDAIDPVLVRRDLKEVDQLLDQYQGDTRAPEYAQLVSRELWAAAQLELYGDPPPPRLRNLNELQAFSPELDADSGEQPESKSENA